MVEKIAEPADIEYLVEEEMPTKEEVIGEGNEDEEYIVESIDEEFLNEVVLEVNGQETHENKENSDKIPDFFTCDHCPFSCRNNKMTDLVNHVRKKHTNAQIIECSQCNSILPTESAFWWHSKIGCQDANKVKCPECHMFVTKSSLNRHINNVHRNIKHACEKCGKTYTLKENLKVHMKKHHFGTNGTFNCRYCDKSYNNWTSRYYHEIGEHSKDFKLKCQFCQKNFLHKTQLEDHIATSHTGVKNGNCDLCGESFSTPEAVKEHREKVHAVMEFQCKYCEKKFLRRDNLRRHERSHQYEQTEDEKQEIVKTSDE